MLQIDYWNNKTEETKSMYNALEITDIGRSRIVNPLKKWFWIFVSIYYLQRNKVNAHTKMQRKTSMVKCMYVPKFVKNNSNAFHCFFFYLNINDILSLRLIHLGNNGFTFLQKRAVTLLRHKWQSRGRDSISGPRCERCVFWPLR